MVKSQAISILCHIACESRVVWKIFDVRGREE